MKAGFNQTQTADFIGVDKSTVSHEVHRNRGRRGYRALVTLVERKSRLTLIAKVAQKTTEAITEAIL